MPTTNYFETAYSGENLIDLLKQKVAQKVAIISSVFQKIKSLQK
jgi:hypothetical protein